MVITRDATSNNTTNKYDYFNELDKYNSVADGKVGFNIAFGVFDFRHNEVPDFEKYFRLKVYAQV
jgi:hypothetical protein